MSVVGKIGNKKQVSLPGSIRDAEDDKEDIDVRFFVCIYFVIC